VPRSAARARRDIVAAICGALVLAFGPSTVAQALGDDTLKSIAILDFELIDDQHELSPATVEHDRLRVARLQLATEFAQRRLYRVVDVSPAADVMAKQRAAAPLHACNGCELDIARIVHADRVLVGWVQKVSNLILNINIQIEDATSGDVLLNKSVDLRGNTDESWRRGVSYLVQSMVDKGQANR